MVPGAVEAIHLLIKHNKNVFFITNNSTASRKMYVDKFEKKGFRGLKEDNILCSSYAAARYLAMNHFSGRVFVIGEQGIYLELKEHGIEYVGDEFQLLSVGQEPPPRGTMSPIQLDVKTEANVSD